MKDLGRCDYPKFNGMIIMRKIWIKCSIGIVIAIVFLQIAIAPTIQRNNEQEITAQTVLGGQYTRLMHKHNQVGDWLGWQPDAAWDGPGPIFNNTGSFLYTRWTSYSIIMLPFSITIGTAKRYLNNISTDEVRTYNLTVIAKHTGPNLGAWSYYLRYYYTDGTYLEVFNSSTWNSPNGHVFSGVFQTGKNLYELFYYAYMYWPSLGDYDIFACYQEDYYGYTPRIWNWTTPATYIQKYVPTTFATFSQLSEDTYCLFYYQGGGTLALHLLLDWTTPHRYYNVTSFPTNGIYSCVYWAVNAWGNSTSSPTLYFTVIEETFPKTAYLSLFNLITGFPLQEKDFKIYLGQPDSRECINFRSYYGSWAPLNYLNLVNASLTDNFIQIEADHNGLRSPFENGMIYDTTVWNTLQFQVKAFQPTWLVILYNPALWEKDFYLYLDAAKVGYWFDVSIPFFNFTTYVDITHDLLYELGFWVENATILLANIRVSQSYIPSYAIWNQNCTLAETHFDVEGHIKENIAIAGNQTIQLIPAYNATYNFENDIIGTAPNGWAVSGGGWTKVTQESNPHHNIVILNDTSSSNYCEIANTFASQMNGTVELWLKVVNPTKTTVVQLSQNAFTGVYIRILNGKWQAYVGGMTGWVNMTGCMVNGWTHVRITFTCTTNGYDGLAQYYWNVYINGTQYGSYPLQNTLASLNKIYLYTDYSETNNKISIDCVDYSWTGGWYRNRNMLQYITGGADGWYQSPIYDLGIAKRYYACSLHYAINQINISSDILLQYRISSDNVSWNAWSIPITVNTTINSDIARYFQFKVLMYSSYFADRQCYWVNLTYRLENSTVTYTMNPYRLCSLANRQNPNNLIFYSPVETLVVQDFFNNTLFYGDVVYAPFVDIGLPLMTFTFYNWANYTILIRIYRGLSTYIEVAVPPNVAVTEQVFCTNYRVWIATQTMQQLWVTYVSSNRTRNIIIPWGYAQNITFPDFWQQLIEFLFHTPLGVTLFVLFCIYMTYSVYRTIRPPRIVFKVPKVKKTKEAKNEAELRKSVKKIKNEKRIWMGR